MTDTPEFVMERTFDAPRELVWRTWTEAELLKEWYGPNVETIIHELDVQSGGRWLNEMKMQGGSNYQRMDYLDVNFPSFLAFLMATTDENWEPKSNPQMPDWPRKLLTTVTFTDEGEKTHMRLTWAPYDATGDEIACFRDAMGNLGKGWGMGMELLEKLLDELQD